MLLVRFLPGSAQEGKTQTINQEIQAGLSQTEHKKFSPRPSPDDPGGFFLACPDSLTDSGVTWIKTLAASS